MDQQALFDTLHTVMHPELHSDIVTLGMVNHVVVTPEKIQFTLLFGRSRDPFAVAIKKRCEELITKQYPQYAGKITIFIKENTHPSEGPKKPIKPFGEDEKIGHIIAIGSAKGGVGKSTVTAHLAMTLNRMGYKVGILDADLYGPSQPMFFGVEAYRPQGIEQEGKEWMLPAEPYGIKIMSIGFFIQPDDALMWRGPMATNALRQMIRQTAWGNLDFLLIDLPPGTGDIHLSILNEMKIDGAIIVSTPHQVALADVIRGIAMFRNDKIGVPVIGLVENMAWFTPAELPQNRYYIFGKEGTKTLARKEGLPLLAEIPLIQNAAESGDKGLYPLKEDAPEEIFYQELAKNLLKSKPPERNDDKSDQK